MLLMRFQIFDDGVLLLQFGVEEVGVRFEFVGQSLVWLGDELGLVSDSLEECIVNLSLNIVLMVFLFVFSIIIKGCFHFFFHFLFFRIKLIYNTVILFLLFGIVLLNSLSLLSQFSQLSDAWSEGLLSLGNLFLDLPNGVSDLLESLIFFVIQQFFLV